VFIPHFIYVWSPCLGFDSQAMHFFLSRIGDPSKSNARYRSVMEIGKTTSGDDETL
jgi:hypothetical protein